MGASGKGLQPAWVQLSLSVSAEQLDFSHRKQIMFADCQSTEALSKLSIYVGCLCRSMGTLCGEDYLSVIGILRHRAPRSRANVPASLKCLVLLSVSERQTSCSGVHGGLELSTSVRTHLCFSCCSVCSFAPCRWEKGGELSAAVCDQPWVVVRLIYDGPCFCGVQ